ncbi:DUF6415 family natural product biosynthesis protein [Streptomyces sp. NPDC048558]|uniref:DUF6415 family natural product biosynthesis protein n=1 Tax=Streptomyces sp. NPDC048558 TaxID=3155759 RepID=UPI00343B8F7A
MAGEPPLPGRLMWLTVESGDKAPGNFWAHVLEALRHQGVALPDAMGIPAHPDEVDDSLLSRLELLIPEIERTVGPRPKSVAQHCALACVGEARGRLHAEPQPGICGAVAHARRLARVLGALRDHHERIRAGGETPERAALRRLEDHSAKCPTCRAVDDQGANVVHALRATGCTRSGGWLGEARLTAESLK